MTPFEVFDSGRRAHRGKAPRATIAVTHARTLHLSTLTVDMLDHPTHVILSADPTTRQIRVQRATETMMGSYRLGSTGQVAARSFVAHYGFDRGTRWVTEIVDGAVIGTPEVRP